MVWSNTKRPSSLTASQAWLCSNGGGATGCTHTHTGGDVTIRIKSVIRDGPIPGWTPTFKTTIEL